MNIYEYLIKQLDDLYFFQILSHENVYLYLTQGITETRTRGGIIQRMKYDFSTYQPFYYKSIFLLGYSYFEGFLDDIIHCCQKTDAKLEKDVPFKYEPKISRLLELGLNYNDTNNISKRGNLVRNCLMHNQGKVSKRLNSNFPEFGLNDTIILNNDILEQYGNHARKISKELYESAIDIYKL